MRMGDWRNYNHIHRAGRFIAQIMLEHQRSDKWILMVLPQICIAHNDQMVIAVGFDWIFGTVNIGFCRREFVESEKKRVAIVAEQAAKMNVTPRQFALRWGY
jgi:hypothetical protein